MKVKNNNGELQNGLYSVGKGSFIYNNQIEYNMYIARKESLLKEKVELSSLRESVKNLEKLIEQMRDKNG